MIISLMLSCLREPATLRAESAGVELALHTQPSLHPSPAPRMLPAHQMVAPSRSPILAPGGRHVLASSVSGIKVAARATNTRDTSAAASMPADRMM